MNRERAKELREVFNAFCDGKDIQFRLPHQGHEWCDLPKNEALTMTFPADDYEYRIKPQPEVLYVNKWGGGENQKSCHLSESRAIRKAKISNLDYIYIAKEFIEVIKD